MDINTNTNQNDSRLTSPSDHLLQVTIIFPLLPQQDYHDRKPLLNAATYRYLQIVFYVIFGFTIGMFGSVTNIINIMIFWKRGLFSGGGTLNLFFLALADFGVTFTEVLQAISHTVILADLPSLSFDPYSVWIVCVGIPHEMFTFLNRFLTAYISLERCMCVVLPFRVQSLFTPKRSLVYLLLIYGYVFISFLPNFLVHPLLPVKREGSNTTKIAMVFGPNRELWWNLVDYVNLTVLSFVFVVMGMICTLVTVTYIKVSKEWRHNNSATTGSSTKIDSPVDSKLGDGDASCSNAYHRTVTVTVKGDKSMDKEMRLVHTITLISAILCVCFLPEVVLVVARTIDPRINTGGQYERLSMFLHAFKFCIGTLNSSINIFVYYRLNSRYRKLFQTYFGGCRCL